MRVLVANRGEIALRLIQALEELEIESVAIHTATDRLHAGSASHAVEIPNAATFMQAEQMIRIAKEAKCDAIVPGYGFLSESAAFADACAQAGIIFCGPSAQVLHDLGDKSSAKRIAKQLNVPILPSSKITSVKDVEDFACRVEYPVMLKAQDGGGGKGIRIIRSRDDVPRLLEEAMNESPSRQVFSEKAALEGFKHIEIQVVADRWGNVKTVFERECSLQRKFQKVIEIAPSSLPRARITPIEEAAVRMAKHVGYVGLGTFEFLVNARGQDYYFMECNPRIQVEHTITEQVSGLDLAHLLFQTTLMDFNLGTFTMPKEPRGYSIQCRVNAEDSTTFSPSQGTASSASLPSGPGIRVDSVLSRLQAGTTYTASDEYDSLVAKVITTASTYPLALRKSVAAVKSISIAGFTTNQSLLIGLLQSNLMTTPVETDIRSLSADGVVDLIVKSGTASLDAYTETSRARHNSGPASSTASLALGPLAGTSILKKGDAFTLTINSDVIKDAEPKHVKIDKILKNNFPDQLSFVASFGDKQQTIDLQKSAGTSLHRKADPLNASHISSPFAGVLVELLVDAGDLVDEAETIAIFRQGKMELDVRAPCRGTISEIAQIKEGETVGVGALIAVISGAAASAKL